MTGRREPPVRLPLDAFIGDDSHIVLPYRPLREPNGLPSKNATWGPGSTYPRVERGNSSGTKKAIQEEWVSSQEGVSLVANMFLGVLSATTSSLKWGLLILKAWNIVLALSDLTNFACSTRVGQPAPNLLGSWVCQPLQPYKTWDTFKSLEMQVLVYGNQLKGAFTMIGQVHDLLGINIGAGRDLVLHGAEATIVLELTSDPGSLNPSSTLDYELESATNIFADPPILGECWRFPGRYGHVGIQLRHPANITAMSLVYPLREHLSKGMASEAPKSVRVWGLPLGTGMAGCLKAPSYVQHHQLSYFAHSRSLPQHLQPEDQLQLIAESRYDIRSSRLRQVFPVEFTACAPLYSTLVIEVLDNWDGTDTCVYHIGIHGESGVQSSCFVRYKGESALFSVLFQSPDSTIRTVTFKEGLTIPERPRRSAASHHRKRRAIKRCETEIVEDDYLIERQRDAMKKDEEMKVRDARMLQAAIKVVEEAGTCKICTFFMRKPYMLECGHTFCGECIQRSFEYSLLDNLLPLKDADHYNHEEKDCQSVPTSDTGLEELLECLDDHGRAPAEIFRYPCPSYFCDRKTRKVPAVNYTLRRALEELLLSLGDRYTPEVSETADSIVADSFGCLILTDKTWKKMGITIL
ncbi:hypothetical protein DFP72DRAFT_1064519 [Ephemerocybe angulata]|uniref:RING-type domain-containing protein n=1 Tax=Ephemerocybe angulata TaxID=980116 RepID=A0A8H6I5K0_9AGAR|nr:hypothetical protein DFP72DRAFT_1064519 [Tulosesus angulatus]